MKVWSTRFHLALGLSSLVVSVLLLALTLGLVPDREAAQRAGRVALAEAVAASTTACLDDEDDRRLRHLLAFVARRNPELLGIDVRRADGSLAIAIGMAGRDLTPAPDAPVDGTAAASGPAAPLSTDTRLRLPLVHGTQAAGLVELRFTPLNAVAGWVDAAPAWAAAPLRAFMVPGLPLIAATGLACFALFYGYLRRMLRHLDPAQAIPGRVRTAFDTLTEGLLVLDPAGRIVLANRAFAALAGGDAESLVGRRAAALGWTNAGHGRVHDDDTPWAAALHDARVRHNVLMYLDDAAGLRRTFMVNASPVPGSLGKPAGVLVSFDDVTALAEKEIELRVARDAAEAANRAKSDFLAHMSHEIRTPMNAILGFTELLRRGHERSPQEARKYLDIIHGSGRHLLGLINDILDLSKVEAGLLEVERLPCAPQQVVHEVLRVLRGRADEKGVGLRAAFPQALPAQVLTDASRLRQIVTNLVGNALKFTQEGEVVVTLRIDAQATPARLHIDVADTGIGIAADKLDAIFEPFVQAEASTTRQFGGTGLGLAISRRFARALGGDVTVSSTPGRGSTFHVSIDAGPLGGAAWLDPQALAAPVAEQAVADASEWRFPPACVLVVDDGAENRELVRLVLESAGLTVLEAEHGAAALEVVATRPVDLVLMDVQMPVMDGYTATRTLRQRGCTLPVLALTANAMKGFEAQIEAAGFTGHLTKPVDIDAMLADLAGRLGGERVAARAPAVPEHSAPAQVAAGALAPIESRLAQHPRLRKVARRFVDQLPQKLRDMQASLAAGQLAELAQHAHWLKGAGGTVGFDAFFEPARDLETQALQGQADAAARTLDVLQALALRVVAPAEADTADML